MWVSEVCLSVVRGLHDLSVLLPIVDDREALYPSGETLLRTLLRLNTVFNCSSTQEINKPTI